MSETSSALRTNATASGGAPSFQVWSLPCCSRTAADKERRSPSNCLIDSIAALGAELKSDMIYIYILLVRNVALHDHNEVKLTVFGAFPTLFSLVQRKLTH
jgi:hypothetical protein